MYNAMISRIFGGGVEAFCRNNRYGLVSRRSPGEFLIRTGSTAGPGPVMNVNVIVIDARESPTRIKLASNSIAVALQAWLLS